MTDNVQVPMAQLSRPDDLLTTLPYCIGFAPDLALVMAFPDQEGWMDVVRVPLDPAAVTGTIHDGPHDVAALWAMVLPTLEEKQIQMGSLVLYGPPEFTGLLLEVARQCPVPIEELLRVSGERYWDLSDPPEQRGIAQSWQENASLATVYTSAGLSVAPAPQRPADVLEPGTDPRAHRVGAAVERLAGDPESALQAFQFLQVQHEARQFGPRNLYVGQAARLLLGLEDRSVRQACVAWTDAAAEWLWNDLLQVTPPALAANVLGMAALCYYFRGEIVLARSAADNALALDAYQPEASILDLLLLTPPELNLQAARTIARAARRDLAKRA